jgi:hypothetical protein
LNIEKKTNYMVISYKKSLSLDEVKIKIDDIELQRVTEMKYFGVIIDDKLKFDRNTNYTIKILLYKSLVAPHFAYCSSILFLSNAGQFQDMQTTK